MLYINIQIKKFMIFYSYKVYFRLKIIHLLYYETQAKEIFQKRRKKATKTKKSSSQKLQNQKNLQL